MILVIGLDREHTAQYLKQHNINPDAAYCVSRISSLRRLHFTSFRRGVIVLAKEPTENETSLIHRIVHEVNVGSRGKTKLEVVRLDEFVPSGSLHEPVHAGPKAVPGVH